MNTMNTITIERALLKEVVDIFDNAISTRYPHEILRDIRAALAAPATAPATTSIEDHTLERLLDAWDTTVLPKHRDGAMQEWMEALRHEFMTCPDNSIKGRVTSLAAPATAPEGPDNPSWHYERLDRLLSLCLSEPAYSDYLDSLKQVARNAATAQDDHHAQELLAQDITIANMQARHAQELCAYSVTVDNLRAERKPMTEDQIDAAIEAWFANDIVAGPRPSSKRMQAALDAATRNTGFPPPSGELPRSMGGRSYEFDGEYQ